MKKRAFLLLAAILTLTAPLLASCTDTSNVLKIALDAEDEGRYDELFAYFTEQTGYTVKATYGQDIAKLIHTADEPDIIKTSTVVVTSMKDYFMDLKPYIDADPTMNVDQYIDSVMDALTIDGKVYALPTSINTSLLYYNKDLFDASASELRSGLGLGETDSVYPTSTWSYADYQTAGVILSKYTMEGTKPVYTQFGAEAQLNWWGEWLVYVNQMGGSFYEPGTNNHVCAITSPEAIAATEFFVEKSMGDVTHKFAPNAVENASSFSFMSGNVAMVFGGHMGDWYSYNALGLNWDVAMLPTPDGHLDAQGGEISADAFGILISSKKVTPAFSFLKLWTGEAGAAEMYKYGKVGALKSMETIIAGLPDNGQNFSIDVVFRAIEKAVTLPNEKDFSKVLREMVMSDLYTLMYTGRGSETDVPLVLARIKTNVDKYYFDLYGD